MHTIRQLAREYAPAIVEIRRHLHRHPELSFEERATGRYISEQLALWGIPHHHGMAENGVVALIEGRNPDKKVIALRADMDALPILEANEVPYKSVNEGVMHACGHDVHTACLLGAAHILWRIRADFEGTVKCIFQPAEEKLPGGASIMIREGVLENPRPSGIFGQHVHPPLRAGQVGFRPGMFMASSDEISITVTGRGGHGAMPHECVDPVAISAQLIVALQQIVGRMANPTIPSVLTFGKVNSLGGAFNVIPDAVHIAGTFRTMDESWRSEAHRKIQLMAEGLVRSMGAECTVEITKGYPVLYNDEALTMRAREWAVEYLGVDQVVELPMRMTAEDFAYYSQQIPACFYRLGVGNPEKGIQSPVHTNTFDVDESALETGAGLMAWLAVKELAPE